VIGECKLDNLHQNAVFDQYQHLCAYCRGVYILPGHCFPRFINAVKCHEGENEQQTSCIHETWSNRGIFNFTIADIFTIKSLTEILYSSHKLPD